MRIMVYSRESRVKYKTDKVIFITGVVLFALEIWKQLTIWLVEYGGNYDVWYFPFQLCSMPMYLTIIYGCISGTDARSDLMRRSILTFIQDYGLLGGVMALVVHEGLIHKGFLLLTLHGFLWHAVMIMLSLYIFYKKLSYRGSASFIRTLPVFVISAGVAELINVALHKYGDCDMFYISPYHNNVQVVFHDIDGIIGRPAGILLYLVCVALGAYIVHKILDVISVHFRRS